MKKLVLCLAFLVASPLLFAQDNVTAVQSKETIIGTWHINKQGEGEIFFWILELTKDGSFKSVLKVGGDNVVAWKGEYEIVKEKLRLINKDDVEEYNIESLSEENLVIKGFGKGDGRLVFKRR